MPSDTPYIRCLVSLSHGSCLAHGKNQDVQPLLDHSEAMGKVPVEYMDSETAFLHILIQTNAQKVWDDTMLTEID